MSSAVLNRPVSSPAEWQSRKARWWTALVLTASSERQAERYRGEIRSRLQSGLLPADAHYLVVPDVDGKRMGSGGATIHALGELTHDVREPLGEWWANNRVLMIHSGGDSRRLPQYSPSGKLFGSLPAHRQGSANATSTVFDEMLRLSEAWAERMNAGLIVASGDVVLSFDAGSVDWNLPGVTGIGMRQPAEVGTQHGVYVTDESGRVYKFLQKPTVAQLREAGGILPDGKVVLDTGVLRFDGKTALCLTELSDFRHIPEVDLYQDITGALAGVGDPSHRGIFWRQLSESLDGIPFHCTVVDGSFTHVGTTLLFRNVAAEAGGVLDSVLRSEARLGAETVVLECELDGEVRTGPGAILHGLGRIPGIVDVPENTVVHQLPIAFEDGSQATAIRVYGVSDDPRVTMGSGVVTWFGRPIDLTLAELGIHPNQVWPGIEFRERSLWNAELFPATDIRTAWRCARWMMGETSAFWVGDWVRSRRLSLAGSAQLADGAGLEQARHRRMQSNWQRAAVQLAEANTDLRPMLMNAPALPVVTEAGWELTRSAASAEALEGTGFCDAASRYAQAAMFFDRVGLRQQSQLAEAHAFRCVTKAVMAPWEGKHPAQLSPWTCDEVTVSAPARMDFGGGWSDTPPFCLDWGGTVLNVAFSTVSERGVLPHPIQTSVRRLPEPLIRLVSEETGESAEFDSALDLLAPAEPGSPFTIPKTALRLAGLSAGEPLHRTLERLGGGLEFRMRVQLPIGSGLGTSSILAATLTRALRIMSGTDLSPDQLSDEVMRLEQLMTTGGGWQDQAGGVFPGAKLLLTGPGLRQRIRVAPVLWTEEVKNDFCGHMVLYYTGLQRVAKNLLRQIVGRYLAREATAVQVLHSIKTLALEMSFAMAEGDWPSLGQLLDRHWRLNQLLDPNTTNAPINAVLDRVKPYVHGAKLAGAGGGGYLMLLAKDEEAAIRLQGMLGPNARKIRVAETGLEVNVSTPV